MQIHKARVAVAIDSLHSMQSASPTIVIPCACFIVCHVGEQRKSHHLVISCILTHPLRPGGSLYEPLCTHNWLDPPLF